MARMPERITLRSELGRLIDATPFVPFEIVMTSGDRYRIEDPIEVLVGEEIIHLLFLDGERPTAFFDSMKCHRSTSPILTKPRNPIRHNHARPRIP